MQYEDFEKLVLARQSCRNFDGQPVSEEAIKKIVDLARLSPSACNSQPWKVYAVIKGESGEKFDLVKKSLQDGGLNKFLDGFLISSTLSPFVNLSTSGIFKKPSISLNILFMCILSTCVSVFK